jgi:hypothetical protein
MVPALRYVANVVPTLSPVSNNAALPLIASALGFSEADFLASPCLTSARNVENVEASLYPGQRLKRFAGRMEA